MSVETRDAAARDVRTLTMAGSWLVVGGLILAAGLWPTPGEDESIIPALVTLALAAAGLVLLAIVVIAHGVRLGRELSPRS